MITKEIFHQHYTVLAEEFGERMSDARMAMHYEIIGKSMNDEEFVGSVKSILASRKYNKMPKIAEIIEHVRPDLEAIATLAVIDIENAISRHGSYSSVSFDDQVVNSIVDHLGGWIAVCRMDLNDWKFAKKEIQKLYGVYARRERHPEHLVGMHERSNGCVPDVKVIGAGYKLPNVRTVPALNPQPKRDMAAISILAESKKVE